jgi:hypothetical protein
MEWEPQHTRVIRQRASLFWFILAHGLIQACGSLVRLAIKFELLAFPLLNSSSDWVRVKDPKIKILHTHIDKFVQSAEEVSTSCQYRNEVTKDQPHVFKILVIKKAVGVA